VERDIVLMSQNGGLKLMSPS